MKKTLYTFAFASLLALGACGGSTSTEETSIIDTINGKEYASAYICPMHCEGSGADAMGQCPVCEMDYVQNPSAQSPAAPVAQPDSLTNDSLHQGHSH